MGEVFDATYLKNALPQQFPGEDSRRLFHGRGHCFPGLEHVSIDWFEPVIAVTLFEHRGADWEAALVSMIQNHCMFEHGLILQRRYNAKPQFEIEYGNIPEQLYARRGCLRFSLQLSHQNIGFFLDAEPARIWLEKNTTNKKVLNLFSYTCVFSAVATSAGAQSVLNMDLSSKSLSIGRDSYRINDLSLDGVQFFANDILKSWSRLKRFGPYDIVIVDPPSFQKGSFIATKDYQKVLRRLEQLLVPGGKALLCLNAPEISVHVFKAQVEATLLNFEFEEQLDAHKDFPDKHPEKALKMLVFRRAEV